MSQGAAQVTGVTTGEIVFCVFFFVKLLYFFSSFVRSYIIYQMIYESFESRRVKMLQMLHTLVASS